MTVTNLLIKLGSRVTSFAARRPFGHISMTQSRRTVSTSSDSDGLPPLFRCEPREQNYYIFRSGQWCSRSSSEDSVPHRQHQGSSTFSIISWNIDMMTPFGSERMNAALAHLGTLSAEISHPLVIFLQEMDSSDLDLIKQAPWIQSRFFITDLDVENWEDPMYGTTVLVDKRLKIMNLFRVPLHTRYGRDGLFVDIALISTDKFLRLCNVHLESLTSDPPLRPIQLSICSKHARENSVHGAVIAGDFNAFHTSDRTLHIDNDLKDVYLELGGEEDTEAAYTWGSQHSREIQGDYPPDRLDKVLFCGYLIARGYAKIGEGVRVEDQEIREQMLALGLTEYVTDHLGLRVDMELESGLLALTGGRI